MEFRELINVVYKNVGGDPYDINARADNIINGIVDYIACHSGNKEDTQFVVSMEELKDKISRYSWRPIEEYFEGDYDWVLVKAYDGDFECIPFVAEYRKGKWYNHSFANDDEEITFEVKYFMDMQTIKSQ